MYDYFHFIIFVLYHLLPHFVNSRLFKTLYSHQDGVHHHVLPFSKSSASSLTSLSPMSSPESSVLVCVAAWFLNITLMTSTSAGSHRSMGRSPSSVNALLSAPFFRRYLSKKQKCIYLFYDVHDTFLLWLFGLRYITERDVGL